MSSRPPGIRSSSRRRPSPAWTSAPALRPVRIPAGMTTVPSGASRSSARSATMARRSSASGIAPSGPAAGHDRGRTGRHRVAAGRRPGRGRRPGPARPTTRRRRRRRRGPAAAGRRNPACRREPPERGSRGGHPERDAVAGRVGPRRDPQLAQAIAQAMPVGATVDHSRDAVDDRRRRARRGRARRSGRPPGRTCAVRAPDPPARPRRGSRRRDPIDGRRPAGRAPLPGPARRPERAPRVVGRHRQLEQQLGEGSGAPAASGRRWPGS